MKKLRKKKILDSANFRKTVNDIIAYHSQFYRVKKSVTSLENSLQNKIELNTIQYLFNKCSYGIIKLPKPFTLPTNYDTKMYFFVCLYKDLLEKWNKISERCFAMGIKRLSEPELEAFIKEHKITFEKNDDEDTRNELNEILMYNRKPYKEENKEVQDKNREETKEKEELVRKILQQEVEFIQMVSNDIRQNYKNNLLFEDLEKLLFLWKFKQFKVQKKLALLYIYSIETVFSEPLACNSNTYIYHRIVCIPFGKHFDVHYGFKTKIAKRIVEAVLIIKNDILNDRDQYPQFMRLLQKNKISEDFLILILPIFTRKNELNLTHNKLAELLAREKAQNSGYYFVGKLWVYFKFKCKFWIYGITIFFKED